ncbi:hypothetical protein DYB32_003516, partial [Aphanomyces invadans]
ISALDNSKAIALTRNLHNDEDCRHVLDYLTSKRGLHPDVLSKYCVGAIQQPFYGVDGASETKWCVTFPWMARQADVAAMGAELLVDDAAAAPSSGDANLFNVVRLKVRAIDDKSKQRLVPKGGCWGLFGWNTISNDADSIVLTEGEFDAMAVYQATGRPAISLPNGCRSLPPAILPLLDRFSSIYLWMDSDLHGQESVEKFVTKLGAARTYVVRSPGVKDANDALLAKLDLNAILDNAKLKPHAQIATFEDLRADVRPVLNEMMNPLRAHGVQSRSIPALNTYLKGFRSGELTVLTGPTGCGKTTLLSQLSLDWCAQGVSTLWGSFEIKNTRLVHKMLTQMAGRSLALNLDLFERTADEFEALPMYFLRFFGSSDVDEVLDAMEYAVYAHDVQHVILDNVQFMMSGQGRGFDKFERQDAALDKFRKFATAKNVHVTLVIHPRKEQDDVDLTLSSVFGTAKATQEADNVLILQRNRGEVKLDVRKNRYFVVTRGHASADCFVRRFDGSLGSIALRFDKEAVCMREMYPVAMDDTLAARDLELQMEREAKLRRDVSAATIQPKTTHDRDLDQNAGHCDDILTLNSLHASSDSVNGSSTAGVARMNGHAPLNGHDLHVHGHKVVNGHQQEHAPEPFSLFTPIVTR